MEILEEHRPKPGIARRILAWAGRCVHSFFQHWLRNLILFWVGVFIVIPLGMLFWREAIKVPPAPAVMKPPAPPRTATLKPDDREEKAKPAELKKEEVPPKESEPAIEDTQVPVRKIAAYQPFRVCEDAMDAHKDFSDSSASHLEIEMREGCFGPFITLPKAWTKGYTLQSRENDAQAWIAFTFPNDLRQYGPYGMADPFQIHGLTFRLQGKGTVVFIKNSP